MTIRYMGKVGKGILKFICIFNSSWVTTRNFQNTNISSVYVYYSPYNVAWGVNISFGITIIEHKF